MVGEYVELTEPPNVGSLFVISRCSFLVTRASRHLWAHFVWCVLPLSGEIHTLKILSVGCSLNRSYVIH